MDAGYVGYFSEGHFDVHADFDFFGVTVNHIKQSSATAFKVDDGAGGGGVNAAAEVVMAEADDLAGFVSEAIWLEVILGLALEANVGAH